MKRIGLVTCRRLPEPDPDRELLANALRAAGMEAAWLAWDGGVAEGGGGSGADPAAFDCCVLRSTWNYPEAPDAFLAWIDAAEHVTALHNPAEVLRWNLHKAYMLELAGRGVAIIPTAFVERGAAYDVAALAAARGWDAVVVKPAVSAGSLHTRRFAADELDGAQAFLDEQASVRDMLVQRYMRGVEAPGERALICIAGELTHGIRKQARFADGVEVVSEAFEPSAEERAFAERVLAAQPFADLLYARVDVVPDEGGALCLSELELIEPSLFLLQHPPALERLVAAIRRVADAVGGSRGRSAGRSAPR